MVKSIRQWVADVIRQIDRQIDRYNPGQNISDKLQFFCEIAPYGKSSIYFFQEFSGSIDKI